MGCFTFDVFEPRGLKYRRSATCYYASGERSGRRHAEEEEKGGGGEEEEREREGAEQDGNPKERKNSLPSFSFTRHSSFLFTAEEINFETGGDDSSCRGGPRGWRIIQSTN